MSLKRLEKYSIKFTEKFRKFRENSEKLEKIQRKFNEISKSDLFQCSYGCSLRKVSLSEFLIKTGVDIAEVKSETAPRCLFKANLKLMSYCC